MINADLKQLSSTHKKILRSILRGLKEVEFVDKGKLKSHPARTLLRKL